MRDRTNQARGVAVGYAVASGLYVAAGIFVIAACLVGAGALFRWIELHEGTFAAFGITGGVLLALAILCAAIAANALNPKRADFAPLSSRVRVALRGTPAKSAAAKTALSPASSAKLARATTTSPSDDTRPQRLRLPRGGVASRIPVGAGALMAATLFGWAIARRLSYPRKPDA